jgi:hypothetical protein
MRTFLGRTWLPALLFALPAFLIEFLSPGVRRPPAGTFTLYMLIAVPPLWWATVARKGPVSIAGGAWRGALCGATLILIPAVTVMMSMVLKYRSREQSGGLAVFLIFGVVIIAAAILVPLGAGIGALTTLLQPRRHPDRLS